MNFGSKRNVKPKSKVKTIKDKVNARNEALKKLQNKIRGKK